MGNSNSTSSSNDCDSSGISNSFTMNQHYPIIEEFHRAIGKYNSEQARSFIDKHIDERIESESLLLNGERPIRKSKDEVYNSWMKAYKGKWRNEPINNSEWSATTDGDIDTLYMSYKLIIPVSDKPDYIMYFHLLTQFNNKTHLWVKSAYTQFKPSPTASSIVASSLISSFYWYVNQTSDQLNVTMPAYNNLMDYNQKLAAFNMRNYK